MSIKSEISRINTEVSTQADLLTQIRSAVDNLPDAGSGGGGSGGATVETCTLTINTEDIDISTVGYTKFVNGVFTTELSVRQTTHVLENVACGTAIIVTDFSNMITLDISLENAEEISYDSGMYTGVSVFKCLSGGAATITIGQDNSGYFPY